MPFLLGSILKLGVAFLVDNVRAGRVGGSAHFHGQSEPGHGVVPNEFQIPRTPDADAAPDWLANAATEYANGGRDPREIAPARPIRRAVLITVSDHS